MCQIRNQRLSDISHGLITQLKTLQQKSKNFIKDTCNRKQMIIKRDLIELGICYRKECSKKGETFIKRF